MQITETNQGFIKFITRLCGLVGGIWVTVGFIMKFLNRIGLFFGKIIGYNNDNNNEEVEKREGNIYNINDINGGINGINKINSLDDPSNININVNAYNGGHVNYMNNASQHQSNFQVAGYNKQPKVAID